MPNPQLRITLNTPVQRHAHIGIPIHINAIVPAGTYLVDVYLDGYAHLVDHGWIKCPPPVSTSCPQYREDDWGVCHWQMAYVCDCCIDNCRLSTRPK